MVGGAGAAPLTGGNRETCELQKMYLMPEARGIGLARALLDRCIQFARQTGFRTLYAETNMALTSAVAPYKEYGFEELEGPLGETGHAAVTDCYLALEL